VAHLKRENTRLEEEMAFLKKAAAYFAKPSKLYTPGIGAMKIPFQLA